ncbi:MAG: glycine/sarcosine/betaine reductase component B subunit [Dehalococcoidia bacterium]
MPLTLANHPVSDLQYGDSTHLEGTTLYVNSDELLQYLLQDSRLRRVHLDLVHPGDVCRFGVVFDILEPRAKATGEGSDFPGVLGPLQAAGQGTTHVLQGAAVSVIDTGAPLANGKVVEMSGEPAATCPYASLHHLVITPETQPELERHVAQHALRLVSVKAAAYLARSALDQTPLATEIIDTPGPAGATERAGLPRFAYIGQIHSRQRVAEVDEQIFYGANTTGMVPVMLHPNEWLDGAIIAGHQNQGVETYFYQNHPIITELIRWHQEGKINFVGTIATMAASDNEDRERNCMLAAQQARWNLAADAVILTKFGGGAPHADMSLTAKICEGLGMSTSVQVSDMSSDRRAESALLFNYPEVDAIVYVGGNDTGWEVPAVERVIAATPELAAALGEPQRLASGRVCGVTSQQGASHLRSFIY